MPVNNGITVRQAAAAAADASGGADWRTPKELVNRTPAELACTQAHTHTHTHACGHTGER
jgi:hypothetical protein